MSLSELALRKKLSKKEKIIGMLPGKLLSKMTSEERNILSTYINKEIEVDNIIIRRKLIEAREEALINAFKAANIGDYDNEKVFNEEYIRLNSKIKNIPEYIQMKINIDEIFSSEIPFKVYTSAGTWNEAAKNLRNNTVAKFSYLDIDAKVAVADIHKKSFHSAGHVINLLNTMKNAQDIVQMTSITCFKSDYDMKIDSPMIGVNSNKPGIKIIEQKMNRMICNGNKRINNDQRDLIKASEFVTTSGEATIRCKKYLDDIIQLNCVRADYYDAIKENGLFVKRTETETTAVIVVKDDVIDKNIVINLVTGVKEDINSRELELRGFRRFIYFNSTPELQRKGSCLFINEECNYLRLINLATCGQLGKSIGIPLKISDAIRIHSVESQVWEPTVNLGKLKNQAVLQGTLFDIQYPYNKSSRGISYLRDIQIIKIFREIFSEYIAGMKIKELLKIVKKIHFKARPNTNKTLAFSTTEELMLAMLKDITLVTEEQFNSLTEKEKESKKYAIVYGQWNGTPEDVMYLTDKNSQKTSLDSNNIDLEFLYLEVTKDEYDNKINTSIPMLLKLMIVDNKIGEELVYKLSSQDINQYIAPLKGESSVSVPSIYKEVDNLNTIQKLYYDVFKVDKGLAQSYVNTILTSFKKKIKNMEFSIKGSNYIVVPCHAPMFGKESILSLNEIFVPIKRGDIAILGDKSCGDLGIIKGKYVDFNTIVKRIKNIFGEGTLEYKAMLGFYTAIPKGMAVISAHEDFKKIIGISDHEFSTISCIEEEGFVSSYNSRELVVIDIDSSKEESLEENTKYLNPLERQRKKIEAMNYRYGEEVRFDTYMFKAGFSEITKDVKYIEALTLQVEAVYSMLFKEDVAKREFQKVFWKSNNHKEEEYISPIKKENLVSDKVEVARVTISKEVIRQVINNITNCNLNDFDNIKKAILDLGICFKYYQDLTEKGFEKALFPTLLLKIGENCVLASRASIKIDFDKEEFEFTGNVKFLEDKYEKKGSKTYIDHMLVLKKNILEKLLFEINNEYKKVGSVLEADKFKRAMTLAEGTYREGLENLIKKCKVSKTLDEYIRFFKSNIIGIERTISKFLKNIDDNSDSKITFMKDLYTLALNNTSRISLPRSFQVSQGDRQATLYSYLLFKKLIENTTLENFSHKVLQEEMLIFWAKKGNDVAGYRVFGNIAEGVHYFENSSCSVGYIEEELENGWYEVQYIDGVPYVIFSVIDKLIEKVVKSMKDADTFVLQTEIKDSKLVKYEYESEKAFEYRILEKESRNNIKKIEKARFLKLISEGICDLVDEDGIKVCSCYVDIENRLADISIEIMSIIPNIWVDDKGKGHYRYVFIFKTDKNANLNPKIFNRAQKLSSCT